MLFLSFGGGEIRSAMSTASGSSLSSSSLGESTTPSSQSPLLQVSRVASYQAISALAEYARKGVQNSIGFMEKRTEKQYESAWKQFCHWCHQKSVNPFSCPLDSILLYLSDLYAKGSQYRTINSHRSAISMTHSPIDNVCVGAHSLVSRLMKGILTYVLQYQNILKHGMSQLC